MKRLSLCALLIAACLHLDEPVSDESAELETIEQAQCDSDPEHDPDAYQPDQECLRAHGYRVSLCYKLHRVCRDQSGDSPYCLDERDACVNRSRKQFMTCLGDG